MTYFTPSLPKAPILLLSNSKVEQWQRKKPYLSVRLVASNHQDGWENVPPVMSGRVWSN